MSCRAILPTGFGINCEAESAHALRLVGAEVDALHLNDLCEEPRRLARAQLLVFAGGFAFGDHLGAGRALANRVRCRLGENLQRFISDGGLVLGICNGFQTMARLGLLPDGAVGQQRVTLAPNAHGRFYDGWVRLVFDAQSPCLFTRGLEHIDVPVRHGEGRLISLPQADEMIRSRHLAPCYYADPDTGRPTPRFPDNPNGSQGGIAGLCDPSGRLFGLMPHPEAFLYPENHPQWRQRPRRDPDGLAIFRNAVTGL